MSFLHPGWLLLMLILPFILLGAVLTHRGHGKAWKSMVAPRLRKQLVREGSYARRWISLALGLLGCALIILTIARPYGGETTTTEQIRTRNILIALDTSRSMLVRDGSPDRMTTAKAMAIELLHAFPNDRIGVIAFSGTPVLMAPLTIDHSAVHETISQIDTRVIPSGGSDLPAAVQLAIKTFKKSGQKSNALIMISDGEDHSQRTSLAGSEIRESGIAVCTIGVGSPDGGVIPDLGRSDGKFRDVRGHTVHSRMIPDALDQLARAGGGSYVPASDGADSAIRSALSFLKSDQQEGRKVSVPNESYQWFLLPAIILLVLSLLVRSHLFSNKIPSPSTATATAVAVILIALGSNLHAATDTDRAKAAYERKDYEAALDFFSKALPDAQGEDRRAIQFSLGSSAYRLKQWDHAMRYFSHSLLTKNQSLQEQSHYNLGNSLFNSGWNILNPPKKKSPNPFLEMMRNIFPNKNKPPQKQPKQQPLTQSDVQHVMTNWQDAITHYQAALEISPENKDADHNRKEVEKLLKQLQEAMDQAKQESKDSEKQQENDDKEPKEKGDQPDQKNDQPGDGENPKEDPEKNDQGKPEDDPNKGDAENKDPGEEPKEAPEKNDEPMEQKAGESDEAFAARILKELSDAETRPVSRRLLRLRRPAKDW